MVTKLASGELVFSSSLATGLTILLKLAEINTCFNGNAALGKHNNFHTSYNLFFQQNKCFKMLALFPFPSHSNWWLCVQLLASMFSFRRNATLSINAIPASCLLLHALHDDFLSHVCGWASQAAECCHQAIWKTIKKSFCVLRSADGSWYLFSAFFSHFSATSLEKASPLAEGYLRHRSVLSGTNSTVSVVKMTPLSFLPGAKITKYLGIINMFFIRETTSLREVSCLPGMPFVPGNNFLSFARIRGLSWGVAQPGSRICHLGKVLSAERVPCAALVTEHVKPFSVWLC